MLAHLAACAMIMSVPALAHAGAPAMAEEMRRIPAAEANQGVASDGDAVYAIDNNAIGKYAVSDGQRVSGWTGSKDAFPHLNSCAVVEVELVCAASNYPSVPQASTVEIFDKETLRHIRSVSLAPGFGSLTVMMRHAGKWWAIYANYDNRGTPAGRDHRDTWLVRMNDAFQPERDWLFPPEVLSRFAPSSASGAVWLPDGMLLVSGHDRPEVYVLSLPAAGATLDYVHTIALATHGQAIDLDSRDPSMLWSIDREARQLVRSRLPGAALIQRKP